MDRLINKVVVVTGGSNGIGSEVVNVFLKNVAFVIILDKIITKIKKSLNKRNYIYNFFF